MFNFAKTNIKDILGFLIRFAVLVVLSKILYDNVFAPQRFRNTRFNYDPNIELLEQLAHTSFYKDIQPFMRPRDEPQPLLNNFNITDLQNVESFEIYAADNSEVRIALSMAYEVFHHNIPKSLYYAKLNACDRNATSSYDSYARKLLKNYPDNKEYLKTAYAMILFSKLNAQSAYDNSSFEDLAQKITSKLYIGDTYYIADNYETIVAEECEGILADHSEVPTDEKLNRYAFPLKSD
jgi:hypothetical protein